MLALSILKDKNSWPWIVKGVGKVLLFELKHLCSIKVNSVLRRKDNESIKVLSAEFYFHKPITVHLELYLFYCFIYFLLYIGQY